MASRRARVSATRVGAAFLAFGLIGFGTVSQTVARGNPPAPLGPVALVRAPVFVPTALPKGARFTGLLAPQTKLDIDIVLAPAHPAAMAQTLRALYGPSSPEYHQWLSSNAFSRRFGPSASDVAKARRWISSKGLTPGALHGFVIPVLAPAKEIASALRVRFDNYRLASGRLVYRATTAPSLPASLTPEVSGIVGLDDVVQLQNDLRRMNTRSAASIAPHVTDPTACSAVGSAPGMSGVMTPDIAGAHYGIGQLLTQGLNGNGETIALYEAASHDPTNTSTYLSCFGLTNPVVTRLVDGGGGPAGVNSDEADIDIEEAATQAPGATIRSYEGPNTAAGATDTWTQIVQDDVPIVSTSWGLCEPEAASSGWLYETEPIFEQAALQGQTILAASGDQGSEGCYPSLPTSLEVDFPASDPYITAVGGTTITSDPNSADVVWNEDDGSHAGGGGLSQVFSAPNWQRALATPSEPARAVPDVSADAGTGQAFYTCTSATCSPSEWYDFGGTSIAAPLIAGMLADLENGCAAPAGVFGEDLSEYATPPWSPAGVYGYALTDITAGDNNLSYPTDTSYLSGPGYDLASGLGTPIASGLECPEVTSIQPSSAVPGSEVTLGGSNLQFAEASFGGTVATTVSSTPTQEVVVVPEGSGTVSVSTAIPVGTGTATVPFTFAVPPPTTTTTVAPPAAPVTVPSTTLPPTPPPAPTPQIVIASSSVTFAKSVGAVKVSCRNVSCRGTVELTENVKVKVKQGKKFVTKTTTVVLATASYALGARKSATVELRLNATGTSVLAHAPKGPLREVVVVAVRGGPKTTKTVTIG